jgi:hypothetical protein
MAYANAGKIKGSDDGFGGTEDGQMSQELAHSGQRYRTDNLPQFIAESLRIQAYASSGEQSRQPTVEYGGIVWKLSDKGLSYTKHERI